MRTTAFFRRILAFVFVLMCCAWNMNAQNNALHFDGVNDYVQIPAGINIANSSFTIEFWAQRTRVSGQNECVISQGNWGTIDQGLHLVFLGDNNFRFGMYGDDLDVVIANTDFNWHHWVVTFNKDDKKQKVYKDGVLLGSRIATGIYSGTGPIVVGKVISNEAYFGGSVDELRIWNFAKNGNDLLRDLNKTYTSAESGLLAYYTFNQGVANGNNSSATTLAGVKGGNGALYNFSLSGNSSNWISGYVSSVQQYLQGGAWFSLHVDKRWQFSDEGDDKGGVTGDLNSNSGVQLVDYSGTLAFSAHTWQDNSPRDENMEWMKFYLKNNATGATYQIAYMDVRNNNQASPGTPYGIIAYGGGTIDFVQKRYVSSWSKKLCYFHYRYNDDSYVKTFIQNAGANLKLYVEYRYYNGDNSNNSNSTVDVPNNVLLARQLNSPSIGNQGWYVNGNGNTAYGYDWVSDVSDRSGYQEFRYKTGENVWNSGLIPGSQNPKIEDTPSSITADKLNNNNYTYGIRVYKVYQAYNTYFWPDKGDGGSANIYSPENKFTAKEMKYPVSFTANDNSNGTVTLNWTIPTTGNTGRDNSDFEIQRSKSADFSTIDRTINAASNTDLKYDAAKGVYSFIDVLPAEMRQKGIIVYSYRIRRMDAAYDNPVVKCDRSVNTDYKKIETLTPTNTGTGKVKLTWTLTGGLWNNDELEFALSNSGTSTTSAPADDARTDSISISPCTPVNFTLKILKSGAVISEKTVSFMLPSSLPGEIAKLSAYKGYLSDKVQLRWNITFGKENIKYYIISRKAVSDNSDVYTYIATVNHIPGSLIYQYEDRNVVPGTYYYYKVDAFQDCNGAVSSVSTKQDIGFSQPFGTITGRITYTGSVAVKGVTVRAEGKEAVKNRALSTSYFQESFVIDADKAAGLFSEKEGTLQFWNNHTVNAWAYFGLANSFTWMVHPFWNQLHFGAAGEIKDLGARYQNSNTNAYNVYLHYTMTYKSTDGINYKIFFYRNAQKIDSLQWTRTGTNKVNSGVGAFTLFSAKNYLDEIRFWNICLTPEQIAQNYDRYLSGNEPGLTAYYRCDETVPNDLFDISRNGIDFNERHAHLYNTTREEINVPSGDQLALKTYTDANGNYLMNNIPYAGDGSQYTITPAFGVHQFDPTNRPLYFNASANTFNGIDFTDVSSFKVNGKVTYAGGEYPVEGVQLNVDGVPVSKDGKLITTDATGHYEISVPIGKHYITVVKQGHKFVNNGRYPALENTLYTFEQPVSNLNFSDSTLMRVAGRVSGGEREGKKPLGFGASKANLGKATIVIQPVNTLYALNTTGAQVLSNGNNALINSKTIVKPNVTTGGQIVVETDAATGEFLSLLPPIQYSILNVSTLDNNVSFNASAIAPFTPDVNQVKKDSLKTGNETKYFQYNKRLDFNYRVDPQFEITDIDTKNIAFGDSIFKYTEDDGAERKVKLYRIAGNQVTYSLGVPVFTKSTTYKWQVYGYEKYTNPTTLEKDIVPLSKAALRIDNALASTVVYFTKDDSLAYKETEIKLDSLGKCVYKFKAGFPNLVGDHKLSAKISYDSNGKTITWPESGNQFKGYVFGAIPIPGNDFITKGPDIVNYVLRDPPGSGSYAYMEKGSTYVATLNLSRGGGNKTVVSANEDLGTKSWLGIGSLFAMDITETEVKVNVTEKWEMNVTRDNAHSSVNTYSNTTRIETGDSEDFVGEDGDLYIGTSTNILYGMVNNLSLYPTSAASSIQSEGANPVNFVLENQEVLRSDLEFSTMFNYSQYHIINDLIPTIKKLRNALIKQGVAPAMNNKEYNIYYSKVPRDDENFGKTGFYTRISPASLPVGKFIQDSVALYNSWIGQWEKAIEDNEKAKVNAFKGKSENISFDAGAKIEKSSTLSKNEGWKTTITHNDEISVGGVKGVKIRGVGVDIETSTAALVNYLKEEEASTENSITFGYVLADQNQGNYYSADVYKPYEKPDGMVDMDFKIPEIPGSSIFRVRGGKSSCPYEAPSYTKYFEQGKHLLNEGTFQIEKPAIYIGNAKNATAENISAGREATFELQLSNLSAANMAVTYQLAVRDGSNPNGLILSIDGTPLTTPRLYQIAAGGTITKTLKVRQSSLDILDYNNLCLLFTSSCQTDLGDSARINVQFVPSSTPLTLKLPTTLINKENGSPKITYQVSDYERNFKNFASIRLQYKDENEQDWKLAQEYVNNTALVPLGDGKTEITASTFSYDFDVKNLPDGRYDVRAISVSKFGADEIIVATPVQKVIKDVVSPQVLGNPAPVTGILTPDGEVSVMFNEDIKSNYITDNFLSVRGVLNGYTLDHNVAVKLNGSPAYTEASVALADKSFSLEGWVKRNLGEAGTLFAHENSFKLGFTTDNKVTVTIGGQTFTSANTLPSDNWQYVAFTYNNDTRSFTVRDLYETTSAVLIENQPLSAAYKGNGRLYVGANADGSNSFNGSVHNMALWNKVRTMSDLSDRSTAKTGRETGLIGYWSMNEGHGASATDISRSRHITLPSKNSWYLHNVNYAPALTGSNSIQLKAGTIPLAADENFALEFWFLGNAQTNATLFSCGDGINDVNNSDKMAIGFDTDGKLSLRAKGTSNVLSNANYLDGNWHHFALNVIRGGYSSVYVDGEIVKQIVSGNIGAVNYGNYTLGASKYLPSSGTPATDKFFTGSIDEVRVWKSTLSASVLKLNRFNRLTGNEKGLAAYYPFERTYVDSYSQNVTEQTLLGFTLNKVDTAAVTNGVTYSNINVPSLKEARATEYVNHTFTASNNKVVVNITEPAFRIEGCTLEMTLSRVSDLNGNVMNPVSWTAYIDLNRLKWSEDNVSFVQEHLNSKTLDVTISNQSGKDENWVISNIPSWLSVSKTQGTLKPLTSEKITLTSLNSTPIGSYEENIYLTGNNQIAEPLPVSLKVTGAKPLWSFNPNDFEYTMNVVGTLKVENVLSEDTEDLLAAFVNDTCVGIASPKFFKNQNTYFTMANLYGKESMMGKKILFKVWDASTGRIYPVVSVSQNIVCGSDAVYGALSNPVIFNAVDSVEQQIGLGKGWNWISFNVQTADMSPKNVFTSVKTNTELVKSKTTMTVPSGDVWVGTINSIDADKMYKIKETAPETLNFTGVAVKPAEVAINLNAGWSWIGYTPQGTMPLASALADAAPAEGDVVKGKTAFSVYNGTEWVGILDYMSPGFGYMYKTAANRAFHYPVSFALMKQVRNETNGYQPYFTPKTDAYYGNMNIIAQVKDEKGNVVTNCELGAFAGEECRGTEIPRDLNLVYLTVAGEDERNDSIRFKIYNPETNSVINVDNRKLKFTNDAIIGTLSNPYIVIMKTPTGTNDLINNKISIYPTLADDKVFVDAKDVKLQQIVVSDVSGKLLMINDSPAEFSSLNVGRFAGGVYLISVTTADGTRIVKRIIKK